MTEIAESVETAKTKGINEATKRRALRMKAARFNAIPMYSFTGATGDCLFLTRKCLNKWNFSPLDSPHLTLASVAGGIQDILFVSRNR
jgi:hypothetical protein